MDAGARLLAAARESRLVIFAGAGVSMAPPTNLPSWRDFNRSVVSSLAAAAASVVTEPMATRAAELVLARHARKKLPPEYQAQVLAETLHGDYFEVLRHLDSDRPNPTHLAIAWLARLGCVRTVVTTNFDRTLETAFAAVGAPLDVCYQPDQFRALAKDLGRLERRDGPCHLLKLHGSVDDPATLIDTLAQRKRGLAAPALDCVRKLLHSAHWLFLGYSGLDLEAERNYLALQQEAERAIGFTWFVRAQTQPLEVVARLKELYGARGDFVEGELPAWLLEFTSSISEEPRGWIERRTRDSAGSSAPKNMLSLDEGATAWAQRLPPEMCALALTFVVMACAEPQTAAELAERLLASIDARPVASAGSLMLKSLAANSYGLLIAGLGRHAEAVQWLELAVASARRAGDEDSADRFRGNLAQSLETLGRVREARAAYDAALAGYRRRADPAPLAFGLTNLASHLIRQVRFDEARELAEEAVRWAASAGDERMRGAALNDLGMIAKLQGQHARALEILSEVEALFTRLGNDEAVAAAAGNRADVLAQLERFDEAERIQLETLHVSERLGRLDNVGSTCMGLGALARMRRDATGAEHWYSRAREVFRTVEDPSNEGFAALRLAQLKVDGGHDEDALAAAHEALPLAEGRNPALTSDLWELIGKTNLRLGYVVRAEQAYRKVCELMGAHGNRAALAGATTNLGTALLLQQRNPQAAEAFAHAAAIWRELGDPGNLEYCELGETAVRLDQRIAALSNAGHAARTRGEMESAAREMLELYPDLIAMYERIGATPLVAEFCASAGSTAKFVGQLEQAGSWYRRAGEIFQSIGRAERARASFDASEDLLRTWTNALMENGEFERALPDVLSLASVAEQLGHAEMCASASLNAAIIVVRTSQDYVQAKALAERALALLPADSGDVAQAQMVVSHCNDALSRR